jgi:hypothetical protein
MSDNSLISNTSSELKRADRNVNNDKTEKNVKMLMEMWKYSTTLWFL